MSTTEEKQKQLKHIASIVRALITSRKPPVKLREIINEYPEVENQHIPFRKLGYNSAEDLLRDTGEFFFDKVGSDTCIITKYNAKSAHIASLVKGQKKSKPSHISIPPSAIRKPQRIEKSWNKSTYSSNVFKQLPSRGNRFLVSQARANFPDRNNNGHLNYNRNHNYHHSTNSRNLQQNSKESGAKLEDLRKKLDNMKQQKNPLIMNGQKIDDLRQIINKKHQKNQQHLNDNQNNLREKGNSQIQQDQNKISPRPILGQNTNTNSKTYQQHQQKHSQHSESLLQQRDQMMPLQKVQRQLPHNLTNSSKNSVQNRLITQKNGEFTIVVKDSTAFVNGVTPTSSSSNNSDGNQNPFDSQILQQIEKQKLNLKSPSPQNITMKQQPEFTPQNNNLFKSDPLQALLEYCSKRNYNVPEYKIFFNKSLPKLYQARVTVNDVIYSTYPIDFETEQLAKQEAARKALNQFQLQEKRNSLPFCNDGDFELIDKLYKLLSHSKGTIAKNIPELFEEEFKLRLPERWYTLVSTSSKFFTEASGCNSFIIFAKSDNNINNGIDNSTISPAINETSLTTMKEVIKLPWGEKYWNICIKHCVSPVEVWINLIGEEYSIRFYHFIQNLNDYMTSKKERAISVHTNRFYLFFNDDCWFRVLVKDMDKAKALAFCFFIDFGDSEWIQINNLYNCEPQFLQMPAQAIPISLFGLEDFVGYTSARGHLEKNLLEKCLVADIVTKERDFYDSNSNAYGKIQASLVDTSSTEDVWLNRLLLKKISEDAPPPPALKTSGLTTVLVSHISDDGYLYLKLQNSDVKYVEELLEQIIESKFNRDQHKVTVDDLRKYDLFLICDDTGVNDIKLKWYRGALIEKITDNIFKFLFIDNGQTRPVHISNIFLLESLSKALCMFPYQTIKVSLDNIPPITKNVVGRMRALLPVNCEAMVKIPKPGNVCSVIMYRRIDGPDTLCTINDVLHVEHELEIESDVVYSEGCDSISPTFNKCNEGSPTVAKNFLELTRGLTITSVPNSPIKLGELQKLKYYKEIPGVDGFFQVRVSMSSNPSNFAVQPYEEYPSLKDLMKDLKDYCENNDEFIPNDMVEIGQAYAAKNSDGFYHRVTVVKKYDDMIQVNYCDFGDTTILRSDELKVLIPKYRQIPKMAIPAKLNGLVPVNNEYWSSEDCKRFRELTVGKTFVSIIKKISNGQLPDEVIVHLELIDTSNDDDININELLLKEKRAIIA